MGLRKYTCNKRPLTARNAPPQRAAKDRGSLIFHTMKLWAESPGPWYIWSSNSDTGMLTLPMDTLHQAAHNNKSPNNGNSTLQLRKAVIVADMSIQPAISQNI
jgi:hypothetical protein